VGRALERRILADIATYGQFTVVTIRRYVDIMGFATRQHMARVKSTVHSCVRSTFGPDGIKRSYSGPLVNSYLSAVRFNLLHSGVPIEFFTHPLVCAARAATEREWRVTHPESDGKTLPASVEFCLHLSARALEARGLSNAMEQWTFAIMAKTAFTCLLRVSEYMITKTKHYILAGSLTFERRQITQSGDTTVSFIFPALVHTVPKHELTEIDYNVRSAKNDQPGVGLPFHMERELASESAAFDVVGDLYDWCCVTIPPNNAPMFSWAASID